MDGLSRVAGLPLVQIELAFSRPRVVERVQILRDLAEAGQLAVDDVVDLRVGLYVCFRPPRSTPCSQ